MLEPCSTKGEERSMSIFVGCCLAREALCLLRGIEGEDREHCRRLLEVGF